MLLELTPAAERQYDLLHPRNGEKQESVMVALDKLNHKYGDHTVFYAAAGMNEKLKMMRRFTELIWHRA